MKKLFIALGLLLSSCGPKSEFPPETVQAYQTDDAMRLSTLRKCGDHSATHTPFATQADTDECQKAAVAQGNVNYTVHLAREKQANDRLAAEINGLGTTPSKPH